MSKIEGKILYSEGVLDVVLNLAQQSNDEMYNYRAKQALLSGKTYLGGPLRLWRDEEHLHITFHGRRTDAKKLEAYIKDVNMDGTHQAMTATLKYKEKNRWVKE